MAGEPITGMRQRANTVSPTTMKQEEFIAPVHEEAGEPEKKDEKQKEIVETGDLEDTEKQSDWERVQEQVDDFNVRVTRHFEDNNDNTGWQPPMVKTPAQPTREEWLRHQLTHTPYAPWCRHCCAARAVRNNH